MDDLDTPLVHQGFLKLNFDSAKRGTTSSSLGYVIRGEKGDLILAGTKALHPEDSILFAEACALREGIKSALTPGCKKLIIEGDNLMVINAINRVRQIPWEIRGLIEDSTADLSNIDECVINHCYREANQAADLMVAKGSLCISLSLWFSSFDPPLSLIICKDALGYPFQRG
ncbi:uncharacterized protein [Spinacia oleracea]|uniref:RNase H type-1 domain-containing protein n=1 Tax=Spinacia oleracea TaxID=3562 RepID=A0A9R0IZ53_SPIOL|nr:uncharacterized protein LOC110796335 [Spinacia oleracea]